MSPFGCFGEASIFITTVNPNVSPRLRAVKYSVVYCCVCVWFLSHFSLFFFTLRVSVWVFVLVSWAAQRQKPLRHPSAAPVWRRGDEGEVDWAFGETFSRPPIGHLVLEVAHFEQVLFICFFFLNRVPNVERAKVSRLPQKNWSRGETPDSDC